MIPRVKPEGTLFRKPVSTHRVKARGHAFRGSCSSFSLAAIMSKKKPKLAVLADRIAAVRRIVDVQQVMLHRLRMDGQPTGEAEAALQTYASSLAHLVAHADLLREEARAKKGETKKSETKKDETRKETSD
jgi:hypothetical protein